MRDLENSYSTNYICQRQFALFSLFPCRKWTRLLLGPSKFSQWTLPQGGGLLPVFGDPIWSTTPVFSSEIPKRDVLKCGRNFFPSQGTLRTPLPQVPPGGRGVYLVALWLHLVEIPASGLPSPKSFLKGLERLIPSTLRSPIIIVPILWIAFF